MTLPQSTGIGQGSVICSVGLPRPWPPVFPFVFRQQLEGGHFLLEVGINSRLRSTIYQHSNGLDSIAIRAETCPIEPNGFETAIISIIWELPRNMKIWVNGHLLACTDGSEDPLLTYRIENIPNPDGSLPIQHRYDFSNKNARAIERRRGRLQGLQPKPGRVFGGQSYLIESLEAESCQLRSLIALMNKGETFHAAGLAARLRLLLLREGQYPLLQTTAALWDLPLIAYTAADPVMPIPIIPTQAVMLADISPSATTAYANPVDIDAWLALRSIQIETSILSHEKVIAEIGNTFGSHLDSNLVPSVVTLRSGSLEIGKLSFSMLADYLTKVGIAVLALSEFVLARAGKTNP